MQVQFAIDIDPSRAARVTDSDIKDVQRLMASVVDIALSLRPARRQDKRDQLVALLLEDAPLRPLDVKRAMLEARALSAVRDGTEWLTATEVAKHANLGLANPIATISRWKQQRRIFALHSGGKDYYPRYALGTDFHPLPVIKDIMAVLPSHDPDLLAAWFDSTSRFLGGKRPRELMATAPAKVLACARNMIEVQENHG
ncbi:hypothetical protein [Polaromonas glacialis]|uniref:hypothetical protein n=1 Tax=Polaromonas glacialis TaxID=866564 RepID=UPI0004961BB9|nr:hypothetical protein [Polaromonas glacialis]